MRLKDFFPASNTETEITGNVLSGNIPEGIESAKYKLLKQIKALIPGQTLQGTIIGKDNIKIQIQLASNLILDAKLDQNISVELGKSMTFQVKNNGKNLTLCPLFENLAMDENVLKALDMAAIPVSERTVKMAKSMMQEGMSIDKQSLQEMVKQVNNYSKASPDTIVQLHKLEIPLSVENIEQAENYKTMNYQVEKGLKAITDDLLQVIETGYGEGKIGPTNQLLKEVVKAVFPFQNSEAIILAKDLVNSPDDSENELNQEKILPSKNEASSSALEIPVKEKITNLLEELFDLPVDDKIFKNMKSVHAKIGKELIQFVEKYFQEEYRINPEQLRDGKSVQELYLKIEKQLIALNEAVSQTIGKETSLFKSVNQMQNNIDFMNQINQAVQFVQLPIKLSESNAHGDLYVYTNKKNLTQANGSISAFLHLDMEHLGKVDVYVTMEAQRVGTRFQVQDEKMLSFLEQHISILNDRLEKRGYTLSCEMKLSEEETQGVLETILKEERTNCMLSEYGFDMRA